MSKLNIENIDCLEGMKKIPSGTVKTIIADPPYAIGATHNGKKSEFSDLIMLQPFFREILNEFQRILTPDGECYFFSDWNFFPVIYPVFEGYFGYKNLIVWDKESGPGHLYGFRHELISYGVVKGGKVKNKHRHNVWKIKGFASGAKKTNGEKVHSCQKPIELMEQIIEDSSEPGDLILEPFVGSGSACVAALRKGRKYIGFEIQDKYFKIAEKRILEETIKEKAG